MGGSGSHGRKGRKENDREKGGESEESAWPHKVDN